MIKKSGILTLVVALISMLILGSCSVDNKKIEIGESVYKNIFEEITSSDYTEFDKWENDLSNIPKWINSRFYNNMTEDCYSKLITDKLYQAPIEAYKKEKKIETDNLKIKKDGDSYKLFGYITLAKYDNVVDYPEVYNIKVSGNMKINDKNVITDINIDNFNELLNKIK